MASAMETLITACLKYFGYTRQQLDETIVSIKHEFESFRNRAVNSEQRMERVERMVEYLYRDRVGNNPDGAQVGAEGNPADRQIAFQLGGEPASGDAPVPVNQPV